MALEEPGAVHENTFLSRLSFGLTQPVLGHVPDPDKEWPTTTRSAQLRLVLPVCQAMSYGANSVQVCVTGVACSETEVTAGVSQFMYPGAPGADTTRSPTGTSRSSLPSELLVPVATTLLSRVTSMVRDAGALLHGGRSGL